MTYIFNPLKIILFGGNDNYCFLIEEITSGMEYRVPGNIAHASMTCLALSQTDCYPRCRRVARMIEFVTLL